jgi:hypothetical protein
MMKIYEIPERKEWEEKHPGLNTRFLAFCKQENKSPDQFANTLSFILFINDLVDKYKKLKKIEWIQDHDDLTNYIWEQVEKHIELDIEVCNV